MLLGGALMSTIGAKLIRNNMRVVAFGIALVGVSVVGLGVVHNLLAYLLIDVVNGLASAICMGRCAPSSRPRPMRRWWAVYSALTPP